MGIGSSNDKKNEGKLMFAWRKLTVFHGEKYIQTSLFGKKVSAITHHAGAKRLFREDILVVGLMCRAFRFHRYAP